MSEHGINIAEPKVDTASPRPPGRRRYFLIVVILASIAIIGFKLYAAAKPPAIGSALLRPQGVPWLAAVKQFFFHQVPAMDGLSDDRVNILVMGIGGAGHEGPYLSDTNIIVSIKPSTKEVALITIPRDLNVPINQYGWRKINNADAFGEMEQPGQGGEYARRVFETVFANPIPYYIRIDFTAFEEIIDAVGGITIDIPRTFTDATYPTQNFGVQTVHFEKGTETMGGQRALIYARSRHGDNGEGSDFARSRRQAQVINALKEKVLTLGTLTNPNKLGAMYDSVTSHVSTNLNTDQLLYLADLAREAQKPKTLVFDSSPGGFLLNGTGENGAFILTPRTGNFNDMIAAITNIFSSSSLGNLPVVTTYESNPPTTTAGIKMEIQNGTWRAGLAAKWEESAKAKGFTVVRIGNSINRPVDKTTVYVLNPKVSPSARTLASSLFKAPYSTVLPSWLAESYDNPASPESEQGMKYNTDADLLVVLGTDAHD